MNNWRPSKGFFAVFIDINLSALKELSFKSYLILYYLSGSVGPDECLSSSHVGAIIVMQEGMRVRVTEVLQCLR